MKMMKHFLVAGLVLSTSSLVGCGKDDPDPIPATADLTFYHAVGTLGEVELNIGGELVTLTPQSLSDSISVEPGTISFEMGISGAAQSLFSESLGNLAAGPHAFIVTETGVGEYHVFEGGVNRPVAQEGLYHFQVINLSDRVRDVYYDSTNADSIASLVSSPFYQVAEADVPTQIDIYDEGADVATATPTRFQITSESLTAPLTLLLLSFDSQAASWEITSVEL